MRIVIAEAGAEYRIASDQKISTPADVAKAVPEIANENREVFCVLCLDAKNGLKAAEIATVGLLDASLVHPREIFRIAIERNAAAIVLVHNHPSGDLTPSAQDIRITKQIVDSGKIIDIKVLDHVIVSRTGSLSLREEGLVSF